MTSHDMKDLDSVCKRLIILSKGTIIFDGSIESFKQKYTKEAIAQFIYLRKKSDKLFEHNGVEIIKEEEPHLLIRYNPCKITTAQVVGTIGEYYEISDFSMQEPDIEDMVRNIYENQR